MNGMRYEVGQAADSHTGCCSALHGLVIWICEKQLCHISFVHSIESKLCWKLRCEVQDVVMSVLTCFFNIFQWKWLALGRCHLDLMISFKPIGLNIFWISNYTKYLSFGISEPNYLWYENNSYSSICLYGFQYVLNNIHIYI